MRPLTAALVAAVATGALMNGPTLAVAPPTLVVAPRAPGAATHAPQALEDSERLTDFAGAEACRRCHPREYEEWAGSRHSRMVQPATPDAITARFAPGDVLRTRGRSFTFERTGARFRIHESTGVGAPIVHDIAYVLGNRRIQHFLTRRADGALVLLPPSWDVLREEWFPQADIVPTADDDIEPVQVWDKNCFGCHVSQQRKNFDTDTLTYAGEWLDPGTNCETCHGAAAWHVDYFEAVARRPVSSEPPDPPPSVHGQKRPLLPFAGRTAVDLCASCHQNRYLLQARYGPGEPFFDHFLTALPYTIRDDDPDPAYFVDGRTRRFSNNGTALWLSACYLQGGIRCTDCHRSAHAVDIPDNAQLGPQAAGAELCAGCHAELVADAPRHSRHPAGSSGASCVACHMPRTVSGIKATMRDHSMSVPVPSNTREYGVPNACTECHADRSPQWAAERIEQWYGPLAARPAALAWRRRAAAFAAAREQDPSGRDLLLQILRDREEPFVMRANAAGYLRSYEGEGVLDGLRDALADPHALVRATAALSIAAHPAGEKLRNELLTPLTDPSYAVRANAAFALATLGVGGVGGAFAGPLRRAQDEYLQHLALYADSAPDQANRGALLSLRGEHEAAIGAFRVALRLQPEHADARFGLARALLLKGDPEAARRELVRLRRQAPAYPGLSTLSARIARHQR